MLSDKPTQPLLEIERRFLVPDENAVPFRRSTSQETIRQGYIAVDNEAKAAVRIRQVGGYYEMTAKAGGGVAKKEVNIPLTEEDFSNLWHLVHGAILEKRRIVIPHDGHTIELDVFRGSLNGLVIAEVEFDTIEESDAFEPPDWFGDEITDNHQFSNAWMARNGNPLHTQSSG